MARRAVGAMFRNLSIFTILCLKVGKSVLVISLYFILFYFFVYLLIRLFLVLPHCVIILVVTKVIDVIFVDVAMFITTLLLMLQ